MEKARIETFDILKGIGILFVIVGHTFMKEIGPFIQSFHMPLFFIVAGYFYKKMPLKNLLIKNFYRLVVPYLFIVFCTIFIACIKHFKSIGEIYLPMGTIYECGTPAWFLLALFGSKVLFNIIYDISDKHYMSISFVLSSIPCFMTHFVDIDPILAIGSSICSVFFFSIGFFINESNFLSKVNSSIPFLFLTSVVLWLITCIFGAVDLHFCIIKLWIIDFIGACAGVYICYVISKYIEGKTITVKRLLLKTGYFSFVLYSFHAIEYVFPDWHQIASFSDGTIIRPFVILSFRLLFLWLTVLITINIPLLRMLFFPKF